MSADKDQIRDRSDIIDIVGAVVALRKRGKNWQGLCPFHQEKTPSFYVDPTYRTFKCFGCGASGDVFDFVMRYENMSFVEAAEFLARRAGLVFERKGGGGAAQRSERDTLYDVNAAALAYFRRNLERASAARDYLARRGLSHQVIQQFQLGYAVETWDGLTNHLQAQGQDLKVAATAGLVVLGRSGDYYDMFRNRVIFPILDEQERVAGFGGRAVGDEQPKYLNTGETPVFVKSRLLYGLPLARRAIAAQQRTLLMEGYLDVIAAHQAGFASAVATLGTSLTEDHARKLARLAPAVCLVYDADAAGIKATLRASELLEKEQVDVSCVRLPPGEDPDSLLRRQDGAALFQRAIDGAVGRVDALARFAESRHDLAQEAGRTAFLSDLYRILSGVTNPAARDVQLVRYAHLHPMAVHGEPVAIDQMRRELEARRSGKRAPTAGDAVSPNDPTAALAARERDLGLLAASLPAAEGARGEDLSPRKKALGERYRRARYAALPTVVPVNVEASGLTAEQRAENELIRALAEPAWRARVLKRIVAEDMLTPLGQQFVSLVARNIDRLGDDEDALARLLAESEDEGFGRAVREQLQEFRALVANEPITVALIEECAATLRRRRSEQRKNELMEQLAALRQKSDLTSEDKEQVRQLHELLAELKGSGRRDTGRGGEHGT